MRIDIGKDVIEFVPEAEEDLYVLSLIIEPGDVLYGWTVRELRGGGGVRGERVKIYVGLKVEHVEYHAFRSTLRIRGVLIEVPEWFEGAKGSHHTIELMYGLEYRLRKEKGVDKTFVERLLELFGSSNVKALLLSISMEELAMALIKKFGRLFLGSVQLEHGGKGVGDSVDRFRRSLKIALEKARQVIIQWKPTHIIIAGNNMTLNLARPVVEDSLKGLEIPVLYHEQGEGGLAGIYEFERTGIELLKRLNLDYGVGFIEELFKRLSIGEETVAIGLDAVKRALEAGAVDTLIVLDETFKENAYEMRVLASLALKTRASFVIVPSGTEASDRLRGIGGIAALLRYPLYE